ncbi:MmgE/PrpD family protein [Mesorhizobium sp. STM 4661]|uniref:MmgE/PrpD family protein n=1 Tax=Mesorhizobium sp. STM 4661 TaxID=1297570 RepID=UPI0002BE322C|nr:MmgE/PrpD family protein [Mesorhizobium sp. STM 4661]CCV11237.1 putative MmgE/PrpD [Mesorhizobium sp. STM 4661]
MSVARDLAEVALAVDFNKLPDDIARHSKHLLIDAFACIVGGFNSPTGRICRGFAHEMQGPAQATILGENTRVPLRGAILANQGMMRFLDYNDTVAISLVAGDVAGGHPSGSLPTAIAVSELVGASGKAFLEALVAGYQVYGCMLEALTISLEARGFHHGSLHPYVGAAIAGRLMGLNAEQIANAMGIAGSLSVGLDILDATGEEYVMTKNIADGVLSEMGLFACQLAAKGFTGPERIIEGIKGFGHTILGNSEGYLPKSLGDRWFISRVEIKNVPAESTTLGHLEATTTLVRNHDLSPDDIDKITIRTNKRAVVHTGDLVKKYPRNKESADHSSYFLTAMAVLHGDITPGIYEESNFTDPRVRSLIDRVELVHGPEFDANLPAAEVRIRTRDGRELYQRIDPKDLKGDPSNPMSDEDLRKKFLLCAKGKLPESQVDKIIDRCLEIEHADQFSSVLPLLTVK